MHQVELDGLPLHVPIPGNKQSRQLGTVHVHAILDLGFNLVVKLDHGYTRANFSQPAVEVVSVGHCGDPERHFAGCCEPQEGLAGELKVCRPLLGRGMSLFEGGT